MISNYLKICFILIGLTLIATQWGYGQNRVAGIVRDGISGELLIGANVIDPIKKTGTATDNNGYFSLVMTGGSDTLLITYVGYARESVSLRSGKDTILNVYLQPGEDIEEVEVVAFKRIQFNESSFSSEELKHIPSIGSEPDVLKTLQLLPGIQTTNEGSSNLAIRGGGPGQNLFLIDNVPLYYVNHLGGFVSVFNPDMINNVRVLKGGFPAKYGGKLSSVIDISMREGNPNKLRGTAGIGVMGANGTIEGPLNENTSFLISARKTFTELLLGTVSAIADDNYIVTYGFYDLNGKITWRPDSKNSVQLALYVGDDQLIFRVLDRDQKMRYKNKWGNVLLSTAWKRVLSPKAYMNHTLSTTRYRVKDLRAYHLPGTSKGDYTFRSNYLSSVLDVTLKSDLRYRLLRGWSLDMGLQISYLSFNPNKYWETAERNIPDVPAIHALESGLYLENHISLGKHIDLNLGLRGVQYLAENIVEYSLEPRLDLSISVLESQVLNASYMKGSQFAHMVFSSGSFFNNEVWVPTEDGMNPAEVVQYTLGWKGEFASGMISVEADVYRKKMSNLVAYKEGFANLRGDANWKSKLETGGTGKSEGFELFLRKNRGLWTGFTSYAYSQTTRQFDNINQGREYVFDYDRPHCFSLDINRKINEQWNVNAVWVYQTGLPYTPAIARYYIPNTEGDRVEYDYEALVYGERNSERMRSYHRLDVGVNYVTETKRGRKATWTFSVYNLYSRRNPYFYYYNTEPWEQFLLPEDGSYHALKLYQFSTFPMIPSVSFKMDF